MLQGWLLPRSTEVWVMTSTSVASPVTTESWHEVVLPNAVMTRHVLQGWPLPTSTEVWVMTSTSGASPMTTEARLEPWSQLSTQLADLSWPRDIACPCKKNDTSRYAPDAAS